MTDLLEPRYCEKGDHYVPTGHFRMRVHQYEKSCQECVDKQRSETAKERRDEGT